MKPFWKKVQVRWPWDCSAWAREQVSIWPWQNIFIIMVLSNPPTYASSYNLLTPVRPCSPRACQSSVVRVCRRALNLSRAGYQCDPPSPHGTPCSPPSVSSILFLPQALNSGIQKASGFVPSSLGLRPLPSCLLSSWGVAIRWEKCQRLLSSKSGGTLLTCFEVTIHDGGCNWRKHKRISRPIYDPLWRYHERNWNCIHGEALYVPWREIDVYNNRSVNNPFSLSFGLKLPNSQSYYIVQKYTNTIYRYFNGILILNI